MNFNKLKITENWFQCLWFFRKKKYVIHLMAIAPSHKTIPPLDIKVIELSWYPFFLSLDKSGKLSQIIINMSCYCDDYQNTLTNIIQNKFFPTN